MREENVTKIILAWLITNGWNIICYDFPQSGTGRALHPNQYLRTTKNKGIIIPDIVAVKNEVAVFFENKNRFYIDDFIKIEQLKTSNNYFDSITKLLESNPVQKIYYGVAIPFSFVNQLKTFQNSGKIDFAIFCNIDESISVNFDPNNIFD